MCHNVITEPEIGGHTLIGVFDEFVADIYPAVFRETRYIVAKWTGEIGEEFDQSISVGLADGSLPPVNTSKARVRFTEKGNMVRQNIAGLALPRRGLYKCTIQADGQDAHSFLVEAKLLPDS